MKPLSRPFILSFLLLALSLAGSAAAGAVFIPPATLAGMLGHRLLGWPAEMNWPETFETIFWRIRLPHTTLVALAGAALSGSGAAYQGLFRNPLADPYLIGVASGAGLGAVAALTLREYYAPLGLLSVPLAAFCGALLTVAAVYGLAYSAGGRQNGQSLPATTLILAGVAIGAFTSALTSFLMLRSQGELHRAIAWMLGGSMSAGWEPVLTILPFVLLGLGTLFACGHGLNVLQFGEEQAAQLGLPVRQVKLAIIIAASLATAAAVSFSGIIGFIGLVVPHLARLFWGPDYRRLLPLSALGGASALLLADLLARVLLAPQELPVGIITALVGAPFFVWALRRYAGGGGV